MSGLGEELPGSAGAILRRTMPIWAALSSLLALTLGLAYVPMGWLNTAASLGIAAAKAGLVLMLFMQLRRPDPLLRLAAFASCVFVAFLLTLTFAEVLTRAASTQPGTVEPRSVPGMPTAGQRAF